MIKVCRWKRFRDSEVSPTIWERIDPVIIDNYPWDENGYKPKVEVRFFYTESRLYLHFMSYESEIRAVYRNMNEPVYTDSCVEFFFNPDPDKDDRYFNFEINAIGTLLLELGSGRNNRLMIQDVSQTIFNIKSSIGPDSVEEYRGDAWTWNSLYPTPLLRNITVSRIFHRGRG